MSSPPSPSIELPDQAGALDTPLPGTIPPAQDSNPKAAVNAGLYRTVWRWHFYAGMLVAPFLLIASLTGAIYTFHNELSPIFYQDLFFVTPAKSRLTYDEQLESLKRQLPEFTELEGLNLQNEPGRSSQFIVHAYPGGDENPEQKHRICFIDPQNGKLLGTQIMEQEFFHVMLEIHRTLFAGMTGRVLVELATCWGIVLVITGIYLWWPSGSWKAPGIWYPRFKAKFYLVLRDFHAVLGVYFSALAILVLWTGLFVSVVWGTGFTLASMQMNQSLMDFFAHAKSAPAPENAVAKLEPVVATALRLSRPNDNVYFQLAHEPEQAHKIYLMHDGDTNTVRGLDIDQYTGELVSSTPTEKLTPMVRLLALAVSLHQGKTFGLPSKILACLTCVVLMLMSVTGVWMWWDRRPRGTLGVPRKPDGKLSVGIYVLMGILGVIFPVVGISALIFWGIDLLVTRISRRKSQLARA